MPHPALPFASATEILAAIGGRRLSARDALEHYLERVHKYNPIVNAVVVQRIDAARAEADAADRDLKAGVLRGPLHGLPMTVKESFDVAGLPTTWGLARFAKHTAASDAIAVRRLRSAGAIIFGKTNVPTLLADWQTYNDLYGTTNNPWDVTRSPGGSSGGAAAALAAGLTALELGTDIGASLRNPAHYCGVYSHKPTYDIVTLQGHTVAGLVAEPDLNVAGPMSRSARDLELALDVIVGPDDIDAQAWRLTLPASRATTLAGLRVAILLDAPNAPVDADVGRCLDELVHFLSRQGARIALGAWPEFDRDEMHRTYLRLLRSATSRNHSSSEVEQYRTEVGPRLTDSLEYWRTAREAMVMTHRDWLGVNETRHKLRRAWQRFFQTHDALVCPVASTAAVRHDHSQPRHARLIEVNGHANPSIDQLFWAGIATVAYLPATAMPIGCTLAGLPIGAQIIGPQYGDRTTLEIAKIVEREYYEFVPPPEFAR